MMKVLFLPDGSRANPYQRELAQALGKLGVHVTLSDGIGRMPILGAIKAHGRPEVLHLHWTHPFLAGSTKLKTLLKAIRFIVELFLVKLSGVNLVWTAHNLLSHESTHPRLELFFRRIAARFYDRLIVHCSSAREALIRAYRLSGRFSNKIHVIPHGNYINSYENRISKAQARAKLGFDHEATIFLSFGHIRAYKGILLLIDAFQRLDHPHARLLLVGRPADEAVTAEILRRCSSDHRIYTDLRFVPDEEVQFYMNAADVVVLTYRDILTSGSALLGMSFGRAIIAPRLGCLVEILDDRGSLLYDPSEKEGLLGAMKQALTSDLVAMGLHNYGKAEQYDWRVIARNTCGVYLSCRPASGDLQDFGGGRGETTFQK